VPPPAGPDPSYVARRLDEAIGRPLTHPGSEGLARTVLGLFGDVDVIERFAEKAIETLADGQQHDRTGITPTDPQVGVIFIAWNGTHREVQGERYGEYLTRLIGTAQAFARAGLTLAGFLEIDAFVREGRAPGTVEVDVEFSFVPGDMLGFPEDRPAPLPSALIVNTELCTSDELQLLRRFSH
jgi:hypothetical protein